VRYVDEPLLGEPASDRFDGAPEAGVGERPCTVRQVRRWVRVRCPQSALLNLVDSSKSERRIAVSEKELTHVFLEQPGRTTTWYCSDDGVYELGLDTGGRALLADVPAEARSVDVDRVFGEPIEDGRGEGGVAEVLAPVAEGDIG
jgi:hypothetical protein